MLKNYVDKESRDFRVDMDESAVPLNVNVSLGGDDDAVHIGVLDRMRC